MIDIPTFRIYAKITSYVHINFPDGVISKEKLCELIGIEFAIMGKPAIERHYQNMVLARFFSATISGMKSTEINWITFEEKMRKKAKEIAEKEKKEKEK